jgi:hypothetical protein
MKLAKLIDPRFNNALRKLLSSPVSIATASTLKNLAADVRKAVEDYEKTRVEILNKYGDKKEDGSLAVNESGSATFSEDNMKKFSGEITAALEKDVEMIKIAAKELADVKISADELAFLDELIHQ